MIGWIPASAADAAKSAGFFSEVERVFRAFPAETTFLAHLSSACVLHRVFIQIAFQLLCSGHHLCFCVHCLGSGTGSAVTLNSSICFLFAQAFLYLHNEVKAIDTKLDAGFKDIDTKIDRLGSNILATLDGIHNARDVAAEVGHAVAVSPTANRPRPRPPPPP